jgi:virginiamycin B lyase
MKLTIMTFFTSILLLGHSQIVADDLSNVIEVKSWKVPWEGRPRDPFVDTAGVVWFCGQAGNYIGNFDPKNGKFKQFSVPAGSNPHNLIVDDKGDVWYAGNRNGHIGKLNPGNGKIKMFPMPDGISDPHTLVFDKDNNIWFTAQNSNAIGHLNTKTGEVKHLKAEFSGSRPYGIKMDKGDKPWSVLVGTNRIATVDIDTFQMKEIELPRKNARPRRLEVTSNNHIWYVDYAKGYVGEYDPLSKNFNEWKMPNGDQSHPYGTALDARDRIWIAETGVYPNQLIGFDTLSKKFVASTVVESGGSIRHMYFDLASNSFWFGVDSGFIGRASIISR